MVNFLQKYWYHPVAFLFVLLFTIFSPQILYGLQGERGKPVSFPGTPEPSTSIKSSVDFLETTQIKGDHLYYLAGWAFLEGVTDQSIFTRFLVLQSDERTLFFPMTDVDRPDVQAAFPDADSDLTHSGFSAYFSPQALPPGKYEIGIVFQNRNNRSAIFSLTSRSLLITPNTIKLDEIPTPVSLPDSPQVDWQQDLPAPTGKITFYIDGLSSTASAEQTQYQLVGWAFLPETADSTRFERLIVLKSAARTYYLQASIAQRPDVQKAYQGLGMDLTDSGFTVYFSEDSITPDRYSIGILFMSGNGEPLEYTPTNHDLVWQNGSWQLEVQQP